MFQKGNKFGKGRPKDYKHQLPIIRRRILCVLQRRIFQEKNLESVSTTDLLKFFASIMPKDQLVQASQINYISNVPRDDQAKIIEEPIGSLNRLDLSENISEIKTEDIINDIPATMETANEPSEHIQEL